MRRLNLVAIMSAVILTPATARAEDEPDGTWKVRVSLGDRAGRLSILKLQMEGDTLTGVMFNSQGPKSTIDNARYMDGKVSFDATHEWNGQRFTTPYTGTLAGETIQGTTQFQVGGKSRALKWEATRTTDEELSRNLQEPPVAADIDLSDENYAVWRNHILPDPSELAWEQIPWLTTFKDGILAADAAGKPLLLWTMNGHPLGCT